MLTQLSQPDAKIQEAVARAKALGRLTTVFICTGIFFLVLPGTFLGVWNLISVSEHRAAHALSAAWVQAHGHAQAFGWISTFIIGIGFYSLSRMGPVTADAIRRGWWSWGLWTAGIAMRWTAGVYGWEWRAALPLSGVLELAGFLLFFSTVRRHKPAAAQAVAPRREPPREPWMRVVVLSTMLFLLVLLFNCGATFFVSVRESAPALPAALDRRFLLLAAWGFLVPTVWGFNARWLPIFLGLLQPNPKALTFALWGLGLALLAGVCGLSITAAALLLAASLVASCALHVFSSGIQPAKTHGIHPSFPYFVRGAYGWLLIAAALACGASISDVNGGITGASRHALTVGYLATMVFAIGSRILPSFCGYHVLFSKQLMFASLTLLNVGCFIRVVCEIPAYEANVAIGWAILPFSAVLELAAVGMFALNLLATFFRVPEPRPAVSNAAG